MLKYKKREVNAVEKIAVIHTNGKTGSRTMLGLYEMDEECAKAAIDRARADLPETATNRERFEAYKAALREEEEWYTSLEEDER